MLVKLLKDLFTGDAIMAASFNMMNQTIGTGVLFLPMVMKECGIIIGFIFLFFINLTLYYCKYLMYLSLNKLRLEEGKHPRNFSDVSRLTYGFGMYMFSKTTLFFDGFGAVLSYQIVMKEMFIEIFSDIFPNVEFFSLDNRTCELVFVGAIMLCMVILSSSDRIMGLSFISYLSVISITIFFLFVGVLFFTGSTAQFTYGDPTFIPDLTDYHIWFNIISNAGVLVFTHVSMVLCAIHSEFKKENVKRLGVSLFNAYVYIFVIYGTISLLGYLSFVDNTKDNFVMGYRSIQTILMRIIIISQIVMTYPVWSFTITNEVDNLVMVGYRKFIKKKETEDDNDETPKKKKEEEEEEEEGEKSWKEHIIGLVRFNFISVAITLIVGGLGLIYPNARGVVGYSGCATGILLSFVIPPLLYIKVMKPTGIRLFLVYFFMAFTVIGLGIIPALLSFGFDMGWIEKKSY